MRLFLPILKGERKAGILLYNSGLNENLDFKKSLIEKE